MIKNENEKDDSGLKAFFRDCGREISSICLILFKIMIPVSIVVKLLKDFDLIKYAGIALEPLMRIVGLPGDYGLVWATSIIVNMYGGIIVFFSIFPLSPISYAQVTVLGTMILVAHTFPVELAIARKAGVRVRATFTTRIIGALVLGGMINLSYRWLNIHQERLTLDWIPKEEPATLGAWAFGEMKNYLLIIAIITAMVFMMKILKVTGIIDRLNSALSPLLRFIGLSESAAPVTMIGLTLGISYGGGLIVKEAKSGRLSKKDIFFSLILMSLCHSLIEDTLLMVAIGARLSGILLGRVLFTLIIMWVLVKVINSLKEETFNKYFFVTGSEKRKK